MAMLRNMARDRELVGLSLPLGKSIIATTLVHDHVLFLGAHQGN